MRNRMTILLCAALIFAAPSLAATTPKKDITAAKKSIKPTTQAKKNGKNTIPATASKPSGQHKKDKKTTTTPLIKQGKTPYILEMRRSKKVAKQVIKHVADKKTATRVQRKEIVAKAIAQARSQAKIQQASAIESTLYSPGVQSAAVLVMHERSGQIIYEKNAKHIAPIASISKVMTAMVVLDAHLPMNEQLTITEEDIDQLKKTSSRLPVGTKLTRAEMLLLALMSSENRAAHALSRHYPGGQPAFIQAMNQKSQDLGMTKTYFKDPTGLNSGNVSTPHDLSVMVKAAHRYPEIHQFTTSMEYSFISNMTGNVLVFRNTNPLTRSNEWNIGISKTGYINEAGKCLVMQAVINNAPVVIILLASSGKQTRVNDAQRIKKWMETNPAALLNAG